VLNRERASRSVDSGDGSGCEEGSDDDDDLLDGELEEVF
jgi:hypothetical protein